MPDEGGGDTVVAPAFLGLLKRACGIGRWRDDLGAASSTPIGLAVQSAQKILTQTPYAGARIITAVQFASELDV